MSVLCLVHPILQQPKLTAMIFLNYSYLKLIALHWVCSSDVSRPLPFVWNSEENLVY